MRSLPLVLIALSITLGCAHGSQRELACRRGFVPSCKRLIRDHAIRQIENHPWVWECLAGADPNLRFVELTRTLRARPRFSGELLTATLEQLSPSDPELRQCLDEALANTGFAASRWGYAVRVVYRAKLDPDHVARMLASTAKHERRRKVHVHEREFTDPQPSSCPEGTSPDCVVLPSRTTLDVIYTPAFDVNALLAAWSDDLPRQLRVPLQFCFGIEGRLTHVAVLGDDPYPAISAILGDRMHRWLIRPWVVDDRRVESCTVRNYDVELWWHA